MRTSPTELLIIDPVAQHDIKADGQLAGDCHFGHRSPLAKDQASIGAALFLAGSWMNSYSEYARHVWKQRPENRGRLYTEGLFHYSRHPNYLGDLVLFSGLCMIAGVLVTAIVPVLMLAGFVFVNIPVLDAHLAHKYGGEFAEYARRTHKLFRLCTEARSRRRSCPTAAGEAEAMRSSLRAS